MNIKEASYKTGLTKKAIKYYEMEGLLTPAKNAENSYREYDENDILKLNLIGSLRALDIPVHEIKTLFEGNINLKGILQSTLNEINKTIVSLEKSKTIICAIMSKNTDDYNQIGIHISKLRESLELSLSERKEFIFRTLQRLFPGNFGKMIVNVYEPYLNITIDSEAKKSAWIKLVEFLDELDEENKKNPIINEKNPIINEMNNSDTWKTENQQLMENSILFLTDNSEMKEKYINNLLQFARTVNENELFKNTLKDIFKQTESLFSETELDDSTFEECLSILNEDYKKRRDSVREVMKALDERMIREFGCNFNEFMKNI